MGHNPGGFRVWWRALTGSDETLENAYLMRLAGRFSRRIRGYAKADDIPVIDCSAGQRKHELAEEYLANLSLQGASKRYPSRCSSSLRVRCRDLGRRLVQHCRPGWQLGGGLRFLSARRRWRDETLGSASV